MSEAIPVRMVPSSSAVPLENVVVGKDVLELITGSMYVNPLDVYREYVQNAADSLDRAGKAGGRIDIEVDVANRNVKIRDAGIGVPSADFASRMTSIGGSEKRGKEARGFRGVGRLSGLGYCRELLFRSRAEGEKAVTEIRWDGLKFRQILRDPEYQNDLPQVIRDVTSIQKTEEGTDTDEPFFEVELRGLARLSNDVLLNVDRIKDYLGQVAPVPFHAEFPFGDQIQAALESVGIHAGFELVIREMGVADPREEPIHRPHRAAFELSPFKSGTYQDLKLIEIPGIDGGIDAIAWIADHEYFGAIPADQLVRGLRFRVGNIQVGESDVASSWFPETRFNAWFVGEVHILNDKITPNGRRDNFEVSAHLSNLETNLIPELKLVAQRCRRESAKRQHLRRFEGLEAEVREDLKLLESGNTSKRHVSKLAKEVDQKVLDLEERAANPSYELSSLLSPRVSAIRKELDTLRQRDRDDDDPLSVVPYAKRLAFQEVFELIYKTAVSKPVANGIVDKLVKQLAEKYGAS